MGSNGDHAVTTRARKMPDLDDLFEAADAHAVEGGATDHAVGDLQVILRAAWRLLTPAQQRDLFAEPELVELSGLPEYRPLIGHLPRRRGNPPNEGGTGDPDVG